MAQTSGFFEAQWDDELYNEETQSYGDWDRKYLAEEFARYFSNFVSTGVMNEPANQLKVTAGTGMKVVVSSGFAFINGFWFYNSEEVELDVPLNETPSTRYDSVRVRWNASSREVSIVYIAGSITNVRDDAYYDLQLAQVRVDASASVITNANITDVRSNTELCGLINLVHAEDIGDLSDLTVNADTVVQAINVINSYIGDLSNLKSEDKRDLVRAINSIQWLDIKAKPFDTFDSDTMSLKDTGSSYGGQELYAITVDHCNDNIVIPNQTFTFTDLQCTIINSKITADSLADVYFTSATIERAKKAKISVETYNGYLVLTAENTPVGSIAGTIKVRVV